MLTFFEYKKYWVVSDHFYVNRMGKLEYENKMVRKQLGMDTFFYIIYNADFSN